MRPTVMTILTMLLLTFSALAGRAWNPPVPMNDFAQQCKKAGGHYTGSACECPKGSKRRWINPYFDKCRL